MSAWMCTTYQAIRVRRPCKMAIASPLNRRCSFQSFCSTNVNESFHQVLSGFTVYFYSNEFSAFSGVYVPNDDRWPVHFRGIGIRIEDSVCVDDEEPYVLTTEAVKEVCTSIVF